MTGAVAGLATVTPAAGFVPPWAALVIGLLAGAICYFAAHLRTQRDWDDALDVWGVHGVGDALGTILTGFFASTVIFGVKGAFEGGWHQLWVQIAGVAVAAAYAFAVTFIVLKAINLITPSASPKRSNSPASTKPSTANPPTSSSGAPPPPNRRPAAHSQTIARLSGTFCPRRERG